MMPAPELLASAAVLGFAHPVTRKTMRFASDLPEDMKELIDETTR